MAEYYLENLDCAECGLEIEEGLQKLHSVKEASVNFALSKLFIETSDTQKVLQTIHKINPDVTVKETMGAPSEKSPFGKKRELVIIGTSLLLFLSGLIFRQKLSDLPYSSGEYAIFLTAYLLSGWRVLARAGKNLLHGRIFDEYFLMSCATIGALLIHELPEAVGVMIFFQVGEFFQDLSLDRSRRSIKSLLDIRPRTAHLKTASGIADVLPERVNIGDTIAIKPGEKVPLDGIVTGGSSQIDTSPITGEPVPKRVRIGDEVIAGTINKSGFISVEVSRFFKDSSISKILHLVETSMEKKTRTERFISRFAKVYAPVVVGAAVLVALLPPLLLDGALFSDWIYRALVLLVISCPCALVVSIPLGYFGGIGRASRDGILIKGSNYLDALNTVTTVIFDKTGTLTEGVFKVTELVPDNGFTREELLQWAAEAESSSDHPIAKSISEAYGKPVDVSLVENYVERGGEGIQAQVSGKSVIVGNDRLLHTNNITHSLCTIEGTVVHVAVDGTYAGYIVISDKMKKDVPDMIPQLRNLRIDHIGMLTGDNSYAARVISNTLGFDSTASDLLPEEKVNALEKIIHQTPEGESVLFIGDGINDAPVIARADVGVAMGHLGSDAAIETADIVLMTASPAGLTDAIKISRRTRKIIWENIILALIVKGIFLLLGSLGIVTMWGAVFADMGVTLLAISNSIRTLR
jgi:Cd2+/Zn2+-exporting ATPase